MVNSILLNKIKSGGFTFDVKTGRFIESGYAVSPYKELERTIDIGDLTIDHIDQYIVDNSQTLSRQDHYLGAWLDKSLAYLDISIVVSALDYALQIAQDNDQLAVFDLETFTEYFIEEYK